MKENISDKTIAILHDTELLLDSRAKKEMESLSKYGYGVIFCGWNKDIDASNDSMVEEVNGKYIPVENICIKVQHQKGLRENWTKLIRYETRLFWWLIKNRKKYMYIHACNLDTALMAVFIGKLMRKRVVYDIYDDYADCHVGGNTVYKIVKMVDRFVIKHCDAVIICSEKRKQQLAAMPEKLEIIHNAPDINDVNLKCFSVPKSNKLKIAYVGNLTENRLIKELVQVCSEINDVELYIGGAGALEDYIREYDAQYSNISFLGKLKYNEVLSLESQSDVIPALYDPAYKNHAYAAPNKFYEAMAFGKPTIMAHNTGMDEYVEKENTGLTIEFSKDDLKKAILQIRDHIDEWRENENRIKAIFQEKYSWGIMEKRLFKIYEAFN